MFFASVYFGVAAVALGALITGLIVFFDKWAI